MLKRARDPEPELLLELLTSAVERLGCRNCKHVGLSLQAVDEQDWPTRSNCQSCGQPISPERLEVLPETTSCASCARAPAQQNEAVEYCSKCGAVMSLRPSRGGGLTRYELACPQCR